MENSEVFEVWIDKDHDDPVLVSTLNRERINPRILEEMEEGVGSRIEISPHTYIVRIR